MPETTAEEVIATRILTFAFVRNRSIVNTYKPVLRIRAVSVQFLFVII